VPNYGAPLRGDTLILQLKVKSYHKFYVNRFVFLAAERFRELGLPVPSQAFLPSKTQRFTVLSSPFVDKEARDQFERVTHKRLLTFRMPNDSQGIELAYRLLSTISNLTPGVELRAKYIVSMGRGFTK
jgi:small subunit ribosomal protein S10